MNELELIRGSQQGSTCCFARLVEWYQPRLMGYLLARNQNREEVEDIVQETFLNAFRHIKSYNPRWKFSTWIYTIARRLACKQKAPHQNHHDDGSFNDSFNGSEVLVNQLKMDSPTKNIWVLIRADLKDNEFDALWFYFAQNLSVKDIALILDKSVSWVKVSLHRTKKKLAGISSVQQLYAELEDCL